MSKSFDHLAKARAREEKEYHHYNRWSYDDDWGYISDLSGKGKTKWERQASKLQQEIDNTTYPKRLKKLQKKLQVIIDEYPEYFV